MLKSVLVTQIVAKSADLRNIEPIDPNYGEDTPIADHVKYEMSV